MDALVAELLLSLSEEASPRLRGADPKSALDQLEDHYGDLQAAMDWFVDEGRTDEALRLGNALYRFWITKQRFDEGAQWFDRVLGSPGGDARLRGQASVNAGFMPFWLGQDDRAATHFERGIMEAQHMAWPPDERPHYERLLADLPLALGSPGFDQARAAGRSMASNEAVGFALGASTAG